MIPFKLISVASGAVKRRMNRKEKRRNRTQWQKRIKRTA